MEVVMFKNTCIQISAYFFLSSFSLCALALNPNTASVDELADELVGIGPILAEKIVQYREQNGDFETVDDLMDVKGIGSSVIDKNRDQIEFEE